jgi:hypothetical protein
MRQIHFSHAGVWDRTLEARHLVARGPANPYNRKEAF